MDSYETLPINFSKFGMKNWSMEVFYFGVYVQNTKNCWDCVTWVKMSKRSKGPKKCLANKNIAIQSKVEIQQYNNTKYMHIVERILDTQV